MSEEQLSVPMDTVNNTIPEVVEKVELPCGNLIGICKWFNNKLGFGFITLIEDENGNKTERDIFCHYTGICPTNSKFHTLLKGEYVSFSIEKGKNGDQAVNIRGIRGGPLMCDTPHNVAALTQQYQTRVPRQQGYQHSQGGLKRTRV